MFCIVALDRGTMSLRAIVFAPAGAPVAVAHRKFEQGAPILGRVEHDPGGIWPTRAGVIRKAISRADVRAADLAGRYLPDSSSA